MSDANVTIEGITHGRNGQGFEGGYAACGQKYAHERGFVRMARVPIGFRVEDKEIDCMACIAARCAT